MNTTATQPASNGGGHPAVHPDFSVTGSAPAAPRTERVADARETEQAKRGPTAARGNDDPMSWQLRVS